HSAVLLHFQGKKRSKLKRLALSLPMK
ncbi:haloacid dehalogenase-like hydrolase family protein, partial [Vibrio parahaemolyticus V-223/04]